MLPVWDHRVIELIREVTKRFLETRKGTHVWSALDALPWLRNKSKTLKELCDARYLREVGGEYFPCFLALQSASPEIRERGQEATALVFQALKILSVERRIRRFFFNQVFRKAQTIEGAAAPESVNFGLVMAADFDYFVESWRLEPAPLQEGYWVNLIHVKDAIVNYESVETAWYEERKRRKEEAVTSVLRESAEGAGDDAGPAELSQAVDFSFVSDPKLKLIIERDYGELGQVRDAAARKSRLILAGGLIEALLLDALQRDEQRALGAQKAPKDKNGNVKPLLEWNLGNFLDVAVELEAITPAAQKFGHGVRDYRNLVHPGLEVRSMQRVGPEEADIAEKVLAIVVRDLRTKNTDS